MFTERLKELMEERGISRKALSEESGIPYTTIDGWFKKGGDNVRLSTFLRLAEYFEVSPGELIGEGSSLTTAEQRIINRFRRLDEHGRRVVNMALDEEYLRCCAKAEPQPIPCYLCLEAVGCISPVEKRDFVYISAAEPVPQGVQFAVITGGTELEPYVRAGQAAYCVKDAHGVRPGEVGIFCLSGVYYCRQYAEVDGSICLRSLNRNMADDDIFISCDEKGSLSCLGRVILDLT